MRVCFRCGQPDHVKADCPSLKAEGERGAPQVLDVTPLRMFDGRAEQTTSE